MIDKKNTDAFVEAIDNLVEYSEEANCQIENAVEHMQDLVCELNDLDEKFKKLKERMNNE